VPAPQKWELKPAMSHHAIDKAATERADIFVSHGGDASSPIQYRRSVKCTEAPKLTFTGRLSVEGMAFGPDGKFWLRGN
jgi:hypothetical protein